MPVSTVVIRGLITSTLLTLRILPVLYQWLEERTEKRFSRNKMRSLIIFILACAGTVAPVTKMQAQQLPQQPAVLTLQQALDTARANYPAIRAAQLNIEQKQALEKRSKERRVGKE